MSATSMRGVALVDLEGKIRAQAGVLAGSSALEVPLRDVPGTSLFLAQDIMLRHRMPVMVDARQVGTLLIERLIPAISEHLRSGAEVGPSGEVELCVRRAGALHCFPQALRPSYYQLPIGSAARFPMARAVAGQAGVMRGPDSRGVLVVAAYAPLDRGQLGMVVKQDSAELLAPLTHQLKRAALLLLLLVVTSAAVLRSALRPLALRLVQSEQLARGREAHVHAVLDNIAEGVVTIDGNGLVVQCNAAACRLFGRNAATLQGTLLSQLVADPFDLAAVATQKTALRATALRAGGPDFPIELTVTRLREDPVMFVGVVTDCTLRDAAQAAVRRSQQQLEQQVADRTAELRALAAHQEAIVEQERTRIAREIHDELGGVLTGIRSYLSYAQEQALRQGAAAEGPLHEAGQLADAAIDTVRRVISDLRPSVLDHLGLWAALEWYIGQVSQRTGLRCALTIAPACNVLDIDPARATAIFRIVQETLTNVERHACANSVSIVVSGDRDALCIEVSDNGRGIRPADLSRDRAWGVAGMHERAGHFGGRLDIRAAASGGTRVTVHMPLQELTRV